MTKKEQIKKLIEEGKTIGDIIEIMQPETYEQRRYIRKAYRRILAEMEGKQEKVKSIKITKVGDKKKAKITAKNVSQEIKVPTETRDVVREMLPKLAEAVDKDVRMFYIYLTELKLTLEKLIDVLGKYIIDKGAEKWQK